MECAFTREKSGPTSPGESNSFYACLEPDIGWDREIMKWSQTAKAFKSNQNQNIFK